MTLPPIRRQVVVAASPETAYRAWIDDIGAWWPLERFSVFDEPTRVAWADEEIVETAPDGSTALWGTVLSADPPHRISFTWHPGGSPEHSGVVEVAFVPISDELTLVSLEHRGWERSDEGAESRDRYRQGWPLVLARYAASLPAEASDDDLVWLVLDHRPGGAAHGPFFAHPLFSAHREFLAEAHGAGVLVAAGPLPDEPGSGQTVLRVPARDVATWVAAAEADGSVAGDLFTLRVRPWQVRAAS